MLPTLGPQTPENHFNKYCWLATESLSQNTQATPTRAGVCCGIFGPGKGQGGAGCLGNSLPGAICGLDGMGSWDMRSSEPSCLANANSELFTVPSPSPKVSPKMGHTRQGPLPRNNVWPRKGAAWGRRPGNWPTTVDL